MYHLIFHTALFNISRVFLEKLKILNKTTQDFHLYIINAIIYTVRVNNIDLKFVNNINLRKKKFPIKDVGKLFYLPYCNTYKYFITISMLLLYDK